MNDRGWSLSESDVLRSIGKLLDGDRRAIVATIVRVEGSAYRRPGAKMLVNESGEGLGHITAGCLEDEVVELAADVLDSGETRIETYDLMEDDDVWGLGVGCNGIIDVLVEPLDESYRPVVEAVDANESIGVLTVLSGDATAGAKAYYRDGSLRTDDRFPRWLAEAVDDAADALLADGGADSLTVDAEENQAEVFVDTITPAPEFVIIGSGHDVGPVVELADRVDFRVRVVGFRGGVDVAERFPRADVTGTLRPGEIRSELDLDEDTYCVVMTHNFVDDRLTVDELLRSDVPYVGLMGPRERFEEMLEEFSEEGRTFDDEELNRLHTPIGLDLGGGDPYQIAHSIVAEVLAIRNGRTPHHLKERKGRIHDRTRLDASTVDSG